MAIPITTRAAIQRINRALRAGARVLRANRSRFKDDLGDYFVLDLSRNALVAGHIDLDTYGRKLGVIAEYERVADEES